MLWRNYLASDTEEHGHEFEGKTAQNQFSYS